MPVNTVYIYINIRGQRLVFKNDCMQMGRHMFAFLMNAQALNGKAPFRSDL